MSVFVLIGWASLAGWAQSHGGGKGYYQEQHTATEQRAISAENRVPVKNLVNAISIKAPCGDALDQSQSDLCQQWRMAEAADQMVKVSWGQLFLTALSLFGLAGTIYVTTRSNMLLKRSSEQQLRAYLTVAECTWEQLPDGYLLSVVVKNSGQTPAIGVRSMTETYAAPYPDGGTKPFADVSSTHASPLGPDNSFVCSMRLYTENVTAMFNEIRSGGTGL